MRAASIFVIIPPLPTPEDPTPPIWTSTSLVTSGTSAILFAPGLPGGAS